jgi:hypothetical protein
MAEVLEEYAEPVRGSDGTRYQAQACGKACADGRWEGWIEFTPLGGGDPLRSPRETTQPNRVDVKYWASGLGTIYLEGALERALNPLTVRTPPTPRAIFDGPAVEVRETNPAAARRATAARTAS